MNNNIQPDKVIVKEAPKTVASTNIDNKDSKKESLNVSQLLQNTIKLLSQDGLNSINIAKAIQSLKGIFPSEFSQLQLQDRQAQIDKSTLKSDIITSSFPAISEATQKSWFNGQVLNAKVLQAQPDGSATLVINKQSIEIKVEKNSVLKLQPGQNIALVVEKTKDQQISFNLSTVPDLSAKLIQLIQSMLSKQQAMPALLASLDSIVKKTISNETTTNDKQVTDKQVADKQVTEKQVTEKQVTEKQVTDKQVTDKQVTDKQVTDKQVADKQVADKQVADKQVADKQVADKQVADKQIADKQVAEPIVKLAQKLLDNFSSAHQLSLTDGLKQAISNSGIFLENRLQLQKTDNVNLSKLLDTLNIKKQQNNQVLNPIFQQLELLSQRFSQQINSKITIPSEILKLLDQNISNMTPRLLDLKSSHSPPPLFDTFLKFKNQDLNISQLLTQLRMTQSSIDKKLNNFQLPSNPLQVTNQLQTTIQSAATNSSNNSNNSNNYPSAYIKSINEILQQVSTQFNSNNQTLLSSNKSFAQFQAKQFSIQLSQINQLISQALLSSKSAITFNSNIKNDLKLNLQQLLTALKKSNSIKKNSPTTSFGLEKLISSSLFKQPSNSESEMNRHDLPTRNKHAQVVTALQNQILQLTHPSYFQKLLAEQVDGVMSRIVATQASIREQTDSNINMALELPFKFQEKTQVLQLKFTSEDKDDDKNKVKQKIWTANLAFELQSLGAIRIYIKLDGKDVAMQFWTEKSSTQKTFTENFSSLKERLKIAGYRISELTVTQGIPEEAENEIKKDKKGKIDERV